MKLFEVLNDFIAGKKIRNNDMPENQVWLKYIDGEIKYLKDVKRK